MSVLVYFLTFPLLWTASLGHLQNELSPIMTLERELLVPKAIASMLMKLGEILPPFLDAVCTSLNSLTSLCSNEYRSVEGKGFPISRHPIILDSWTRAELRFADALQAFLHENPAFLRDEPLLQEYWQDLTFTLAHLRGYDPQGSMEQRVAAVSGNPLAVVRMVFRLANILGRLVTDFPHGCIEDLDLDLFDFFPSPWPAHADVHDAMFSLLRLSFLYDFPPHKVAQGFLGNVDTGVRLNSAHCYDIASSAIRTRYFSSAVEWARLTVRKLKEDGMISASMGLDLFRHAVETHDQEFKRTERFLPYLYTELLNSSEARAAATNGSKNKDDPGMINTTVLPGKDIDSLPAFLRRLDGIKRVRDVYIEWHAGEDKYQNKWKCVNTWALCSNENLQTAAEKSKLFCWNEFLIHPYWLIGPLKMEFHNRDPDLVQVYEVIGPKLTEKIRSYVQEMLKLSEVIAAKEASTRWPMGRTSVKAWLDDNHFSAFPRLVRAIEAITGIQVRPECSSEGIQVSAYSVGGHYDAHVDTYGSKEVNPEGNRMVTFMYYLDEPEFGGYTGFLNSKVTIKPVKGSAIFWNNINADGDRAWTLHTACPVIMVATKFIACDDQYIRGRQCRLNPRAEKWVKVNGIVPP